MSRDKRLRDAEKNKRWIIEGHYLVSVLPLLLFQQGTKFLIPRSSILCFGGKEGCRKRNTEQKLVSKKGEMSRIERFRAAEKNKG